MNSYEATSAGQRCFNCFMMLQADKRWLLLAKRRQGFERKEEDLIVWGFSDQIYSPSFSHRTLPKHCYIFVFQKWEMPACCAPNCRNGYGGSPYPSGVSIHNFPKKQTRIVEEMELSGMQRKFWSNFHVRASNLLRTFQTFRLYHSFTGQCAFQTPRRTFTEKTQTRCGTISIWYSVFIRKHFLPTFNTFLCHSKLFCILISSLELIRKVYEFRQNDFRNCSVRCNWNGS